MKKIDLKVTRQFNLFPQIEQHSTDANIVDNMILLQILAILKKRNRLNVNKMKRIEKTVNQVKKEHYLSPIEIDGREMEAKEKIITKH